MSLDLSQSSIIIPLYNRETLIGPCLGSLRSAIDLGAELIVVDDGSEDHSAEKVEEFIASLPETAQARLIRQENAGPGAARNTGAEASEREWLIFVDSDDIWLPWSAQVLAQTLEDHADIIAIFMSTKGFASGDDVTSWRQSTTDTTVHDGYFELSRAVRSGLIGSGYFAVRRATMQAVGGFVPHVLGAEDQDLFYRFESRGKVARIHAPTIVAARTDNNDSLTQSMPRVIEGISFLLKRYQSGAYDGAAKPGARRAIADTLQFWIGVLFNAGYGQKGFHILFNQGGIAILLSEKRYKTVLRFLCWPGLALIRPKNYGFSLNKPF